MKKLCFDLYDSRYRIHCLQNSLNSSSTNTLLGNVSVNNIILCIVNNYYHYSFKKINIGIFLNLANHLFLHTSFVFFLFSVNLAVKFSANWCATATYVRRDGC